MVFPHKRPIETDATFGTRPRKKVRGEGFTQKTVSLKQAAFKLLVSRKELPIWAEKVQIISAASNHDVVLLVGETGSGKSTQVPQFLLEHLSSEPKTVIVDGKKKKVGGMIAVTEPRRMAATTLARRVAAEMGTTVGNMSPASRVGYSVRFDTSMAPATKIKFLTEGMLLQEMLRDPWLTQYSVVVVDEAHERSMNVDLLLGFLKQMMDRGFEGRGGQRLKVVVMSATLELQDLEAFFSSDVRSPEEDDKQKPESQAVNPGEKKGTITDVRVQGRQHSVKITHSDEPVQDYIDSVINTILSIHVREPMPGDILVFLPGQEDIDTLMELMLDAIPALPPALPTLMPLPLFASLPQLQQHRAFQPSPASHRPVRKLILSTNIAETSVTIPGVRHVIDTGLQKTKQYRSQLAFESLLVKPISQSSALQRAGRAGREAPGTCHRLYTEEQFRNLTPSNPPEILRVDVTSAVLGLKARGVEDVMSFPYLSAPSRDNLSQALLTLYSLGALSPSGAITPLGRRMAGFPLPPSLSRVLLASADPEFDCLPEAIDIIAALSVESIFQNPSSEERREAAAEARQSLFRREGDLLTMLTTIRAYVSDKVDRKQWCELHYTNHRALQSVCDVRKQLRAQVESLRLKPILINDPDKEPEAISPDRAAQILRCFLTAFAPRTARLCPDGSYKTVVGNQPVAIHPSSVLFGSGSGRRYEAIMYMDYVHTSKGYARNVSAVQMDWVGEAMERMGGGGGCGLKSGDGIWMV